MRRRTFVATATGLGSTLLAGCSGGGGSGGGSDGGGSDDGTSGGGGSGGGGTDGNGLFRLLISDQPAAIGDFESLAVTLSSARVFRADEDEEVTSAAVTETETERSESSTTTTITTTTTAESPESTATEISATETDDGDEGFVEFELDGVTVDLTEVVGDRAVSVLENELEAGRYSGIELRVASAEGVVDSETVDVKVPSDRLRIVRPFEVSADAELSFVFDINVVRKGPNGGYNLLPVLGKSGVVGEDVEVEEVDPEAETDTADGDEDTETTETTEAADGDAGGDGQPTDTDN
jgi:hypothetical protein